MRRRLFLALAAGTVVTGCGTPYGDRISVDYGRPQIGGSITVSDPKLYRREALINERRREVRYIDQLMVNSEKDGFVIGPEIAREVEVIRALAVTAGLSFDPAAGAGYQRSEQTASIRQEIDALQLQLQLEQLKRDAALFRAGLAEQAVPSRDNLGAPTVAGAATALPALSPTDASDLVTRIDALQATLAGRLGTSVAGPRAVAPPGNPIDQFRDRAAYRQVLTSARNAASLDELHDIDGAALYRLTFQVTTLPPNKDYLRTAGIVEMHPVEGSGPDGDEIVDIYLRWLGYLNQSTAEAGGGSIDSFLVSSQLFSRIDFYYASRPPAAATAPPVPARRSRGRAAARAPAAAPAPACPGLVSSAYSDAAPPQGCARISFVAPDLPASSAAAGGVSRTMGMVVDRDLREVEGTQTYGRAMSLLLRPDIADALLEPGRCELRPVGQRRQLNAAGPVGLADTSVSAAMASLTAVPLIAQTIDRLAAGTMSAPLRTALDRERARLVDVADRSRRLLEALSERCPAGGQLVPPPRIIVPERFAQVVRAESVVRVYEVGPREQVQQASTAARAAEAFSLAAAINAKAPSAGAAAKAGLGYSRNAVGKADLIERLPVVVGYAQARGTWTNSSDGAASRQARFGWLLGPRVNTVDLRRGRLELEQGQRTYDLSADLSVSGWRTRLPLEIRTAWSPDWRSRDFVSAMDPRGPSRSVVVELNPSPAEFAQLTQRLGFGPVGRGLRPATVAQIAPNKVRACMAATLVIRGENLWRAGDVIIGGRRMGADALSVLPDMRGLTVEIPAKSSFPDVSDQHVDVQVLTPYGIAQAQGGLTIDGYDAKGCDTPDAPADGPAVSAVSPEVVNACSAPTFELAGSDLEKLTRVRFGAAEGTLAVAVAKAKVRNVSFTSAQLATVSYEVATMQFFAGEKPAGPGRAIRLVERNCGGKE